MAKRKPALPKRVRVCGMTYNVGANEDILMEQSRHLSHGEYIGNAQHFALEITISERLHPAMQQDTLIHEVFHALEVGIGCDGESMDHEQYVSAMSRALHTFINDNMDWKWKAELCQE